MFYKKLPYLEMKVVKVKKRKKCKHEYISWEYGKEIKCLSCGRIFNDLYDVNKARNGENPKGNWVNGENLDKIKFPCFCSYVLNNKKYIGLIYKTMPIYVLCCLNQDKTIGRRIMGNCIVDSYCSLETLIKDYNIHILKGKIIIFEEEEQKCLKKK